MISLAPIMQFHNDLFLNRLEITTQNNIILKHRRHETAMHFAKRDFLIGSIQGRTRETNMESTWRGNVEHIRNWLKDIFSMICSGLYRYVVDFSGFVVCYVLSSHLAILNFSEHQRPKIIKQGLTVMV